METNISVLTRPYQVAAAKRRQKREQIKEIVFDEDARREFLTGFHKRKLQKKEEGKKKAIEREKQEKQELRRERRRMLAEKARENVARIEKAYGGEVEGAFLSISVYVEEEEWEGSGAGPSSPPRHHENEYSDEEQLATVTIVEDFDPSTLLHGNRPDPASGDESHADVVPHPMKPALTKTEKSNRKGGKAKKVKYETKAARTVEREKQRARKLEKAERAGGRAMKKKATRRH
ncbi:nucleolar protein 12-domain-containing protein [Vararia minispora EC-137]|uniref:Nucleolar protein 12-domain-containing protein n=1 Tax=Vararia minispora EC-137 TaxID=1314806 RepID=A0ACB8QWI9_9AGAM|nr:nucleolar protein 12-domain-containing protein [Vararia minispora EC-137]